MSNELIEEYGSIEQAAFAQVSYLHDHGLFHAEILIYELVKQRAELLEALKRVLPIAEDGVEQYGGCADDHEDIVFARKAEANAEK